MRQAHAGKKSSRRPLLSLTLPFLDLPGANRQNPARERRAELEANQDYVRRTLEEGARKARETASVVLDRVRRAVGLA